MNAKLLKFFQTFNKLSKTEKSSEIFDLMQSFVAIDFAQATDVWEYVMISNEDRLFSDAEFSQIVLVDLLTFFYQKNSVKTVKTINENINIRRCIFTYSTAALKDTAFNILLDLLVANKTEPAEEIFKFLVKNEKIAFGKDYMFLLERAFIEIMKKSATKKVELSRKMSDFLLRYASKVKSDEKAIVEQRIKEVL